MINLLRNICGFFLFAVLAFADGGTLLFHQTAGEFDVTVFNKSEAVHAGSNDFSVMVQRKGDNTTVMNATVLLRFEHAERGGDIMRLTGIATHAKATNKTLYATTINLPSTGAWAVQADVSSQKQSGVATGRINVLPPQAPIETYWPYIAMVPALGLAFIINRKLRRKFRSRAG